jgi:hypothetical protein
MYPDFLHLLARERAEQILQFRHRHTDQSSPGAKSAGRPIRRVRHSIGTALVTAGTRLIGSAPATIELFNPRRRFVMARTSVTDLVAREERAPLTDVMTPGGHLPSRGR